MKVKNKYIPANKLAKILKVNPNSIRQYIQNGKIKAIEIKKIYNTWYLIPIDEAKRVIRLTKAYRKGKELVG